MRAILRSSGLVAVTAIALSLCGCAAGAAEPGPAGCTPSWPKTSDEIVRPGQVITISATARLCTPRFTHRRTLTITAVDQTQHRCRLATAQAYPSGAFEQQIRIPASTPPGPVQLLVDGFDIPCPDTGSCAAYETGIETVTSSPHFDAAGKANQVAAEVADRMTGALHDHAPFVALAIVPDGIQALVTTTRYDRERATITRAFTSAATTVPASDRAIAGTARLHITFNRRTRAELDRVSDRIGHDGAWRSSHHLTLGRWGPDPDTDSVRIDLHRYTDIAARLLTHRYGPAVTISTTGLTSVAT